MGMHQELTRIAAERSPEKRLELLHKVTDLYLDGVDTNSSSETYLFNEIMEKIVDQFSRDIKKQVSSTLALLPVFAVFIFFQRYLVEGISTAGLSGR